MHINTFTGINRYTLLKEQPYLYRFLGNSLITFLRFPITGKGLCEDGINANQK